MASFVFVFAALCVCVVAAPPKPAQPPAAVRPQATAPMNQPLAQLQQADPLDYYLDHPDLRNYYSQQQKQDNKGAAANPGQSSRLENLEPDKEVEILPGAQLPQQPPQQPPVSPNLPGLAPGQRVFIVHMPIPGYRPGTIGGYQPVYIVAAGPQGPQGNIGFQAANGFHNAVLVDPSYQLAQPGYNAYPRPGTNLLAYNPAAIGYNAPGPAWWQTQGHPGVVPQQANLRLQPHPAKLQASESLSAEQN